MTLQAHRLPLSLDPLIAEAKRRARQRRSLVIVAVILLVAAGSVGLVRLFAVSPTVAGRAGVVRVVESPRWRGPSVIAAPTLGNVHVTGTYVQLRGIERLIPTTLPESPVRVCHGGGATVTLWLRDGHVFHYGPCGLPASIERLRLALIRYARK